MTTAKVGEGVHIKYAKRSSTAIDIENAPEQVHVQLIGGWEVRFGADINAKDGQLTQRMMYITYQYHELTKMYINPWQIRLEALPMRSGEAGNRSARYCLLGNGWDDERCVPTPPLCAKEIPTCYDAARPKETNALLKFAHDNQWPLKISAVCQIDQYNTVQITYETSWEGFRLENVVVPPGWCWERFYAKTAEDQITLPAEFLSKGEPWTPYVRKENNSIRIIIKKGKVWGPDDEGPIAITLFCPLATIRIRTSLPNPIDQINEGITNMYQGRYRVVEEVSTREWALVASIGNDDICGHVPDEYRLPIPTVVPTDGSESRPVSLQEVKAIHARILETALRTQNYDRGLDKFARKYENLEAMSATLAIQSGWQGDHGWAVYLKQGTKRCLLMDTTLGLTDEEVIWTAMACWALFKPRDDSPRKYPGRLYYPAQFSHVVEKYWSHFFDLPSHPDFKDESPICQERMTIFSQGLRSFKKIKNWEPQVDAEAPEKGLRIAKEAATSRVRPIADGPNQWDMCRSSTVTGGPTGPSGSESSPTLGSTGTCAGCSSPP
jgi:hypothetical protein